MLIRPTDHTPVPSKPSTSAGAGGAGPVLPTEPGTVDLPRPGEAVPGEYIVVFREGVDASVQQHVLQALTPTAVEELPLVNGALVRTDRRQPLGLGKLAPALREHVLFTQPNYVQQLRGSARGEVAPSTGAAAASAGSDPEQAKQYHLENTGQGGGAAGADVRATKAWAQSRGAGVVVAVADTNIDITHPDIAPNVWKNAKEIAGNGKDDDGNGYVDDVNGWNFGRDSNRPQDGGDDHGTHVAGIIGAAQGNGVGGAGVAPDVQIMPLAILTSRATTANAIKAFGYAVANGANVISNSWGNNTYEPALAEAVKQTVAKGVSVVVACGNENWDTGVNGSYPDNYAGSFAVAASDAKDGKASYSNRSTVTVDVAAPGDKVFSTMPGGRYGSMSGTSMAAPVVAGVLALVKAKYPHLSMQQVEERVLRSVQRDGGAKVWKDLVASGGRVDAEAALAPLGTPSGVSAAANGRAIAARWSSDVTAGQAFDVEYSPNASARSAVAEDFEGGAATRAFRTSGDKQWSLGGGTYNVNGLGRGQQARLELTETITEPTELRFAYSGGKGGALSFFVNRDLQFQPVLQEGRKEFATTLQPGTYTFTWLATSKTAQTGAISIDDLSIGSVSDAVWTKVGRAENGATSLEFTPAQASDDAAVRVRADNGRMQSDWVRS